MSYAKPKAMVIEQTYQSDFMRCFNISLHVICNMHMDQLEIQIPTGNNKIENPLKDLLILNCYSELDFLQD